MSDFTSLTTRAQYALTGLLFISVLFVFLLLIYKYITTGKIKGCIADGIIFVSLVVFISYVAGASLNGNINYTVKIPYALIIFISVFFIAYSLAGLLSEQKRNKQRLSSSSVKEALDNLNSGICFADDSGRIVLMNYTMASLISSVFGSYPQTLDEIKNSLDNCTSLGNGLYRFADSRVWMINTVDMQGELGGYTQTAAQDVTKLYEVNEQLESDNEKLKATNEEMQKMLERLAERIREQETLSLKMRVHDDIGTSLIAITNIMSGSADETLDTQLSLLQNAVSYFSNEAPMRNYLFADAVSDAKNMGVELLLEGVIPEDGETQRLITLAARECVTNCIRHANGSRVLCSISENDKVNNVRFTNNGEKPRGEITEGGGLSSLRKRIENSGGEMFVEHSPVFMLVLNLPKRSSDDDKNSYS